MKAIIKHYVMDMNMNIDISEQNVNINIYIYIKETMITIMGMNTNINSNVHKMKRKEGKVQSINLNEITQFTKLQCRYASFESTLIKFRFVISCPKICSHCSSLGRQTLDRIQDSAKHQSQQPENIYNICRNLFKTKN